MSLALAATTAVLFAHLQGGEGGGFNPYLSELKFLITTRLYLNTVSTQTKFTYFSYTQN